MACNINQILNYFGTGKFEVKLNARLVTDDSEQTQTLHAYVTKGMHEFHDLENNYMHLTNEWKSFSFIIDTNEIVNVNNETKSLYEILDPENNEVHVRFQRLKTDLNYAYEICNVSITFYNSFTQSYFEYEYGYRYVSRYDLHQVNGYVIEMKTSDYFDGVYPVDYTKIDLFSKIYESDNDAGLISGTMGDRGGTSYGLYQFTRSKYDEEKQKKVVGSVEEFIIWLSTSKYSALYNEFFAGYNGTYYDDADFKTRWTNCATQKTSDDSKDDSKDEQTDFEKAQYDFAYEKFYTETVTRFENQFKNYINEDDVARGEFYIGNHSKALQNVIFAMSIQFGVEGTKDILLETFYGCMISNMSEQQIIGAIFERITRTYEQNQVIYNPIDKSSDTYTVENLIESDAPYIDDLDESFIDALDIEDKWLARFGGNSANVQVNVLRRHYGMYFDAMKMLEQEGY